MTKKKHAEPPLEIVKELGFSKEGPVIVAHRKRGFLLDVHVIETKKKRGPLRLDAKEILLALTGRLRAHLDGRGLPTDKWPIMPVELDGSYDPKEHGVVADEDLWLECAEESTEPLTNDRLAAEYLHATNRALAQFSDDQLRDVYRLMYLHHLYATVGELNDLAMAGQAAKKGREKGPRVKSERAQELRALILAIATDYWAEHSRLRKQPVNTAAKIADKVNAARAAQNAGCRKLADKTIADHLRVALREAEQQQ
jgi:hypothetical protein